MKQQAIDRLSKLPSNFKVLDVGGWNAPLARATHVLDILPYETRGVPSGGVQRFTKDTWHQIDICGPKPWPFEDKFFDFSVCASTLEDVRDPLFVCSELVRTSKAGYVEVPSRLAESTMGMDRPFFSGWYHHRWLCEIEGNEITFIFKPAMIHAYRRFHFRRLPWRRLNPEYEAVWLWWKNDFKYGEKILIDRKDVHEDLLRFKQETLQQGNKLFI